MRTLHLSAAFSLLLVFSCHGRAESLEQAFRVQLEEANKSAASFFYAVPCVSQHLFYTVPPGASVLLESHTEAELLPALRALKSSENSWNKDIVQQWIVIAVSHVHGSPGAIRDGSGPTAKSIPVVTYALPLFPHHP